MGKIRAGDISSNIVRKHHDLSNSAFRFAVKQGLILTNPAKAKRPDTCYYPLKQVQQLLKLSKGIRLEVLVKLAGLLGLWREEIIGLKWEYVDFEHKKIEICEV